MKGIVLAGGYGTRLLPLTKVTNKHLLPVYNKPMIYYPIQKLLDAGIKKIMIITGPENAADFLRLLGSGKEFGAEFSFRVQDEAGGIAQAIGMCEDFILPDDKFAVILGDNIFEDNFKEEVNEFLNSDAEAKVFLKQVEDPERFGVAEVNEEGKVLSIVEKPENPKSNYAVTGFYLYSSNAFELIKTLKPSKRGELEVSDLNNYYVQNGKMSSSILKGYWTDAGTIKSLYKASTLIKENSRE